MRQLLDVEADAGQILPERAGEVPGLERLQPGFVGHVEGRALVLLGRLDRAVRRVLRRPFGRGLDRGGLGLAERRARVGELDRRARRTRAETGAEAGAEQREAGPRERRGAAQLDQALQEGAPGPIASQPGIDLLREARLKLAPRALVAHCHPPWPRGADPRTCEFSGRAWLIRR
jgi:hypothetical protein